MSMNNPNWFTAVKTITETLLAIPSISPDPIGENACATAIAHLLRAETGLQPVSWPLVDGRRVVACLLRGTRPGPTTAVPTLILMGHYDTVGVDEFRMLDPDHTGHIAFHPDRLRHALWHKLSLGRTAIEEDVWSDLNEKHGDDTLPTPWTWLFGRGAVDMKSGVAVNIALMRHLWGERHRLHGDILFLACPDEENESAGVMAALPHLSDHRRRYAAEYVGLINTDYSAPRMYGTDRGRAVYTGTVGKLLPCFYVLGVPSHVGAPFRGVDAGQIAAELVRRINLNVDLCDRWVREDDTAGAMIMETGMPPITLKMGDLKSGYNVQTAVNAFVYVNWLTYTTSPKQAMQRMKEEAEYALAATLAQRNEQYERFTNSGDQPTQYAPQVLGYEDLCRRVCAVQEWSTAELHETITQILRDLDAGEMDLRTRSRQVVGRLTRLADLQGPAVVVYFAPPYYPHVTPRNTALSTAVRHSLPAEEIRFAGYYPYISDMSFVRLDDTIRGDIPALQRNMPLFGREYMLDFDTMRRLDCPIANIGPWGKDAHGLYERVHMPYSFQTVPQVIYETIQRLLGDPPSRPQWDPSAQIFDSEKE